MYKDSVFVRFGSLMDFGDAGSRIFFLAFLCGG